MSSQNNIDASGNIIDASGNTIDASGNIIDVCGNIIGNINDNNIVISGATSFFSVFNELRKLSVNYDLDYDEKKNMYIKKLNIGIKNSRNILTDISAVVIIEPNSFDDNRTFENSNPDYIINDISNVVIDLNYSKYINGISLHPGRWVVGISKHYYEDPSFNIIEQKTFTIPMRDFLYNNKKVDFFREDIDNQKLFININKNELLNLRNNNKNFFNFLGKQNDGDESHLKSFFELIAWFPENEKTISNTETSWELPNDYYGVGDNRIQFSPTYYLKDGTFLLSENLSDFNEPGFRYSNKTLNRKTFFLNNVVSIKKVDPLDADIVIKRYSTLSEHYYLIQQEKNFIFSNLEFESLDINFSDVRSWIAEIFISPDTKIKNTYESGSETKLTDCSGVYSYSVVDANFNVLFSIGLIGTGELIEGNDEAETENNKQKSYIFKDKNQQNYHVRLSDYNIIYDPIEKSYNGGFTIKYIFRERKVVTSQGLNYYVDVYIFINNIFYTKILDGGVKLNDINYWGYYGNDDNNMIQSVTFLYQTTDGKAYIDDNYSIQDEVTWKKYIPTIEKDFLLSDFEVPSQVPINAPSKVENETDYIGSISEGGLLLVAILLDTGEVMACGYDWWGGLGIGDTGVKSELVSMNASGNYDKTNAIFVTSGYANTFILLDTGEVMGCGWNQNGELGVGDTTDKSQLVSMNDSGNYDKTNAVSISSFYFITAILLKTGEVMTCGKGDFGQMGDGNLDDRNELVSMNASGNYDKTNAISVKNGLYCNYILLNTGEVMSCGRNNYGQLGVGDFTNRNELVSLNASGNYDKTNAVAISSGSHHFAILLNTGEVMCCGQHAYGCLGIGEGSTNENYSLLSMNASGNYDKTNAVAISCGGYHISVLLNTGEVMTCGANWQGRLGVGDTTERYYELVSVNATGNYDKTNAVAIAAGYNQTRIILDTGEVMNCGRNNYGMLGIGDTSESLELVSMNASGNYDKTNLNSTKYTLFDTYKVELIQNIITSNYPRYLTFDGESTTIDSSEIFELTLDMGEGKSTYIEVEDIEFTYRINNANNDKLRFELSNDGTNWVIPGEDSINGIEWLYKKFTRNDIVNYTMPNSRFEPSSSLYESITYPVRVLNWSNGSSYDISQNSEIIFNTDDNTLKYILINKLSFALNQLNNLGYDELSISYSDDNISWIEPEIDWCYKTSINIETPNQIIKLDDTTTKLDTQIAYGYGSNELYPVTFTDSGGLGDIAVNNYSNNENYQYFFDAGENDNISILIKDLRIENNSDQLRIFGSNTMSLDNFGEATYNWEPLTISFLKTSPNYVTGNYFNGNYFTFSKIQINAFLKNNILDDIILNTGYRFIKFTFVSNSDNVYSGWNFTVYKTNQYLQKNGNVFPKTIVTPNDKVIETNYKYIKLSFISDPLFTSTGFEIEIYKKDDYNNFNYGNTFPQSIEDAKKIVGKKNFNEVNSFKYDYRYIKFKYERETSNLFNDTNKWRIRIDNKEKIYRNELLDITETQPQEFKENVYKKVYPIKFKPNKLINLDYPIATEFSYIFDAGESNTINVEFNTFDISHNTEIDNQLKSSLEKDGFILINNKFTVSYSNDNINWEPARISWMHKTDNFIANTVGGRRVANYYDYYDEDNRLITPANVISWYDDTDGFLLPSNQDKAKEIYLNKYKDIVDISWNKINKIYTNYRYVKFILLFETTNDKYNDIDWDIDIHIKKNKGENKGIIPNYNSLNSFEKNNCVYSINYEINSSELNLPIFKSNNKFIKESEEIPYICRYDYKLLDLSKNVILESNIDTDTYDDIFSLTSDYNSRREGKEYRLIPKSTTNGNDIVNIQQKYYYTSKFFSDRILSNTLYIPELGNYKFFTVNKTIVLTIPRIIINQIKENIVSFWRGNEYPTYFDLVLYIWYPWSEKYREYTNSYDSVRSDMRYLLDENLCDEVRRITIDEGIYYDNNLVGVPNNNVFEFEITQFNGRYIFCWTYEVHQRNGLYDKYTPAKYFYDFDYNNMYLPNIEILNIIDFVTDDFIYDPSTPELKYIENNYDSELDISYSKINISLSNEEITNFNDFILKHEKSLESVNSNIKSIKVKFYVWTPNNEKSNNEDGWELPGDYMGIDTDPRITSTPYYFENKPDAIISNIWDPNYIKDGDKIFGYNLDSSGAIVREFIFYNKKSFIKSDITFDISFDSIYISEDDNYFIDYSNNRDVPNPLFYKKNNIRGIPYVSRWEYDIVENVVFENSVLVSVQEILLNSTYDLNSYTNKYSGDYPVTFYDDGGLNGGYNVNLEREIIFESEENKTLCIQIIDFEFNHDLTDTNNIVLKDRLAILTSDDNITYEPVEVSWFFRSGLFGGDNSGNNVGGSYLNSETGFILPANKIIALKKYYNLDTIVNDLSFNEINLIDLNKRYLKFKFISSSDSIINNSGWNIKVFTKDSDENKISSKIIFQEGGLGNISTDFNYKFNFSEDIYIELDKSIKQENPGILDYKDFILTGISLAYVKGYNFYVINNSNVIWQFVIKKPPKDYVFDLLDKDGNVIDQTQKTLENQTVLSKDFVNLTYERNIEDKTVISGINMSFNETLQSSFIDSGRKFIVYIRKSTDEEKIFFRKFKKGRISQILSNKINNRISDWYPLNSRFSLTNNNYVYGKLTQTKKLDLEQEEEIEVEDSVDINLVDNCGLCRDITKTKEVNTSKIRYSDAVKINFRLASRLRANNICN